MVERQQKQLVWVEPSMLLNPTQLVVGHDKTFTFGLTYFVGLEQQKQTKSSNRRSRIVAATKGVPNALKEVADSSVRQGLLVSLRDSIWLDRSKRYCLISIWETVSRLQELVVGGLHAYWTCQPGLPHTTNPDLRFKHDSVHTKSFQPQTASACVAISKQTRSRVNHVPVLWLQSCLAKRCCHPIFLLPILVGEQKTLATSSFCRPFWSFYLSSCYRCK